MCEIFELISKKALLSFLSETWAISPHQHGVFPRRSCPYSLLVLAEAVTRMMDKGHTVDELKALDSVNENDVLWRK